MISVQSSLNPVSWISLLFKIFFIQSSGSTKEKGTKSKKKKKKETGIILIIYKKKFLIILKNSIFLDEEHVHETKVIKLNHGSAIKNVNYFLH